jgi:MarR family transcriptional regulator, transcriptional regulator for hemolysin
MTTGAPATTIPDLTFLLSVARHALATEQAANLARLGVSWRGFCVLSTALTGELTQRQIADRCHIDKTTMVVTLDQLEKAGLAERRPSSSDRRARIVAVTEAGRRLVAEAEQVVTATHADVLAALPEQERDVFVRALKRLADGRLSVPAQCDEPVRRRDPRPPR